VNLFDLLMVAADKAEPFGVWMALAVLLRLRRDIKQIKSRLGIVERRQKSAPACPLPRIVATATAAR